MKNNRGDADDCADQDPVVLGPEPAVPQAGLTPAVAFVHEHLASQAGAVTISALAAMTGLHQNTVREHLDQLVEAGAATKTKAASTGRGRPAWLYRATGSPRTGTSEYLGLASVLAAHIDRTSANPREDGIAAGVDWGRDLAREAAEDRAAAESVPGDEADPVDAEAEPGGAAASSSAFEGISAAAETVTLLDELGFAPEPVGADASPSVEAPTERRSYRLTRCPLLEAAHEHPDIVCGVHLGLVRGALEVFGDPAAESELEPFSEPGACRLHLQDSTAGTAEAAGGSTEAPAGTAETSAGTAETPKSGRGAEQ
ncbi:helix-turn-helix domain-containing protein [Brevibacterium sp.]|uniref:helix-turn-helix transcriptional regulator n=1 Tax=Brevibacterium sp. TaxID=1701 RepID=UPI002624B29A|nr:helix-turn-helix domain-containing protein [Brevibacterium sp.]